MMSTDELQGAEPDPNPMIACDVCGDRYHFRDYWQPRVIDGDRVDDVQAEDWPCDKCQRIRDRREQNESIERYAEAGR